MFVLYDWMTLKASPLSSRRSVRPADRKREGTSTLKGSPLNDVGARFQRAFLYFRYP